ncbi:CLUMA_CG017302, isoform A [Clunio marinus]|uniref:CLUMA_CG017302, isoform A n=1 Tax=Clunio marinus TaxID=568069 RepID=A0A1J1IVG7_9DIPT|nr:CLUMA_CG017302, isoform A [Clunio marinus]
MSMRPAVFIKFYLETQKETLASRLLKLEDGFKGSAAYCRCLLIYQTKSDREGELKERLEEKKAAIRIRRLLCKTKKIKEAKILKDRSKVLRRIFQMKMKLFWMIAAFLPCMILGDTLTASEKYMTSHSLSCNDLNPQTHLDFSMLMGLWYGAEIITHHEENAYETLYESCVVVHLSQDRGGEPDAFDYVNYDQSSYNNMKNNNNYNNMHTSDRRLRLVWDERGKTLEYSLRVNRARNGFWISSGAQKDRKQLGTMLDLPYNQFTGTVQVMKAVGNHLVLTFCETLPTNQIFTIVLTRKPHLLSRDELQPIRSLLRRRGLSVQSVRKVCKNSASSIAVGILTIITSSIFSLLSRKF